MVPKFKKERVLGIVVDGGTGKGITQANRTLERKLNRINKGKKRYGY